MYLYLILGGAGYSTHDTLVVDGTKDVGQAHERGIYNGFGAQGCQNQ